MTADAKLLADLDALVAYTTDKTGKMPMPEVCDIPGTMRRAADALRLYVRERPIWLRQENGASSPKAVVLLEVEPGKWVELIRETEGCPYSHIIEPAGIEAAIKRSPISGSR